LSDPYTATAAFRQSGSDPTTESLTSGGTRAGTGFAGDMSRWRWAMIQGLITSKDVLLHTSVIVRGYGIRCYLECLLALLSRRRITFLELVWHR
jgi:hypothetical protein